ncbi:MAG: ATP-binding protein [Anaerolineae bacterium]
MSKRVLIADDEPLICRALADYLSDCGYETATASDGEEALEMARSESFDVLLVDLRMPKVHGLDVISALSLEQQNLPIVVVSGTGVLGDAIEAMRLGAWDYISKPILDMDEVVVVLDRVLEKAQLIAERDHYQQEITRLNRSLEAEVARQTRDLRTQNIRLAAMNHVAHALSHSGDLDTMLARALGASVGAVNAQAGLVQLLNPATRCLYVARTLGLSKEDLPFDNPLPVGEGVPGEVARSGEPSVGTRRDHTSTEPPPLPDGYNAFAYLPLRATEGISIWEGDPADRQSIVGVLAIYATEEHGFDTEEVEVLRTVGNQLGVAITRTQYAAELRRANLQLEAANADLRRLDTLREQFIQNVAHELRTPLALVRGYVELLAEGGMTPEQREQALKVTRERVAALVELVESITTLQDLSSEPLNIELISPVELLQTACRMTSQRALAAGITLKCVRPAEVPPFTGDFGRLTQALHQLLDNACKFSDPGTTAEISAGLSPDRRYVTISVSDEGIGIPPEEHERIFERFYQVDGSATRRYGGTGLGLALVKGVVEAHDGWVQLESDVGEGSVFTIAIPRTPGPASAATD